MVKRVHLPRTRTYMKARERSTTAGKKGTFMGKWSPRTSGTAQSRAGEKGASKTIGQFGNTLKWLGGKDQRRK